MGNRLNRTGTSTAWRCCPSPATGQRKRFILPLQALKNRFTPFLEAKSNWTPWSSKTRKVPGYDPACVSIIENSKHKHSSASYSIADFIYQLDLGNDWGFECHNCVQTGAWIIAQILYNTHMGIRRSSVGTEVVEAKTGRLLPVGQFPLVHFSVRVFSGGVYCRRPKIRLMPLSRFNSGSIFSLIESR